MGGRVGKPGHLAHGRSSSHVPDRVDLKARLGGQGAEGAELEHERYREEGRDHHHTHQIQHDFEVRIHSEAKEEEGVLLNPLIRLGHLQAKLHPERLLESVIKSSLFLTKAEEVLQEGPDDAEGSLS